MISHWIMTGFYPVNTLEFPSKTFDNCIIKISLLELALFLNIFHVYSA